jgi:glycosyltransferase involved in cell wall biosynthesis
LPYGNLLGQPAAWSLGIKKRVNTCENASWAIDYNSRKQLFIDKMTYKLAKRVIVLTDLSKDYLVEHYKLDRNIITTIGHSIKVADYENIAPIRIDSLKNELGIKPNDVVLGMVARLEDWKGHSYVIEALKDLVLKYPNIKLLIFGSAGDYLNTLNNLINKYHLQQHVFYKGFVKDNIALYKVFNIHVHVPINEIVETFGISIIEGMVSEVPQILTKSGISCDTVKHMENCVEVPYKNSEAIKEAIMLLIENKELGNKLAAQAKKDAIEMFSYEAKVEKHMEVYYSII